MSSCSRTSIFSPEPTLYRGFLYKIKTPEDVTIGYLFGTMATAVYRPAALSQRVVKCLQKSAAYFPEVAPASIEESREGAYKFLQRHCPQYDAETLKEKAKELADYEHSGTSSILTESASSIPMKLYPLETNETRFLTRLKACRAVCSMPKPSYSDAQLEGLSACALTAACVTLLFIKFKIDAKSAEDIDVKLLVHIGSYFLLMRSLLFIEKKETEQASRVFRELVENYKIVNERSQAGSTLIKTIHAVYILKMAPQMFQDRFIDPVYRKGDVRFAKAIFKLDLEIPWASEESAGKKTALIWDYFRDVRLANMIHQLLSKDLSQQKRFFFSIGCYHLLGPYNNLRSQLKQKDWKLVLVEPADS